MALIRVYVYNAYTDKEIEGFDKIFTSFEEAMVFKRQTLPNKLEEYREITGIFHQFIHVKHEVVMKCDETGEEQEDTPHGSNSDRNRKKGEG